MSYTQLTEPERYQIHAFLKVGYTQQASALELQRSPSTILREMARNKGRRGYRPKQAQSLASQRKLQHSKTVIADATWQRIVCLLQEGAIVKSGV